ncbi:MAG: ATP-binding protein [Gammaproteobacteria bacterium]|nr:MAG: ATP-binding protein [Gammaproteobacteria bacterium]
MNKSKQLRMIEMRINSGVEQISQLSVSSRALALLNNFSEKQSSEIELAVNEAVTNVIEHAYEEDETRPIIMKLNFTNDEMIIEILDQGIAAPEKLLQSAKKEFADLPDDPNEIDEGGRGLTLMLNLMDEVEIKTDDNWNILRMKKRH